MLIIFSKLNIGTILSSNLLSKSDFCQLTQLCPYSIFPSRIESILGAGIAFSCPVSLSFFNLKQFQTLSWSFITEMVFKYKVPLSLVLKECFSFRICLVFSRGSSSICSWPYGCCSMVLRVSHLEAHDVHLFSLLVQTGIYQSRCPIYPLSNCYFSLGNRNQSVGDTLRSYKYPAPYLNFHLNLAAIYDSCKM